MKEIKKFYKENPVIIGLVVLALLLGGIFLYKVWSERTQVPATIIPQELARETTVEKIREPEEMVRYALKSVEKKDIDMFLRGCPIDEIGLNLDNADALEKVGKFSLNSMVAPGSAYGEYFPVCSAELTEYYAEQFARLSEAFSKLGKVSVKEAAYVLPSKQAEPEYRWNNREDSEILGAATTCELMALLDAEGKQYVTAFTLVQYDDYWKVLSTQCTLLGQGEEEPVRECTTAEFEEMKEGARQQALSTILMEDARANRESSEASKAQQGELEETHTMIEKGQALLPANYFVANTLYCKGPEELLEKFTLAMQKKDWTMAIGYGNVAAQDQDFENVSEALLKNQGEFAKEVKGFYYRILWEGKPIKEQSLKEMGMSGREIVEKLDSQYSFYLELQKVARGKAPNEYLGYYYYMGKRYEVKFTVVESMEGWQIKEIGEIRQLTKKEEKKLFH